MKMIMAYIFGDTWLKARIMIFIMFRIIVCEADLYILMLLVSQFIRNA